MSPDAVSIRPHPFPFRASLAVTSDIDGCTPEAFEAIHRFLNLELGLDVGDSFWFYSANPTARDPLTYFQGTSNQPSPSAPRIREWIRQGWIDCLHTYGDFELAGGFRREMAERALAELKRHDLAVSVWVNHGGPFHNLQGVGHLRRLGDLPAYRSPNGHEQPVLEYHSDLMVAAGIRFCWIQELTDVVGQERPCGLAEYYLERRDGIRLDRRLSTLALGMAASAAPPAVKAALQRTIGYLGVEPFRSNDLIEPVTLRDGNPVYGFRRWGDYRRDGPEALPELLSAAVLDRLEAVRGSMSLFTHLGKPREPRSEPFLPAEAGALRGLAARHREGRIWVARTSRLLRHTMLRRSLRWRTEPTGEAMRIVIEGVDDPVFGHFLPEPGMLGNLSFACADPARTEILLDGRKLEAEAFPEGLRIR